MDYKHVFIEVLASSFLTLGVFVGFFKLVGGKVLEKLINVTFISTETQLVEVVRETFNKSLESFKADLNRGNIAFQITNAEYVRRQYMHLEELYGKAYEVRVNTLDKVRKDILHNDKVSKNVELINGLIDDFRRKGFVSSIYLDDESRTKVINYANSISLLLSEYLKFVRATNHYEYCLEYRYEQTSEDGDIHVYSDEEISGMKEQANGLNDVCLKQKRETERCFRELESCINKILHQPAKV